MNNDLVFNNRQEAGQKLAELMAELNPKNPIVFAIPRGGVVVAYEVAEKIHAPFDIIAVRKLGTPQNPEFAFGAIAPGNITIIDQDVVEALAISTEAINEVLKNETAEMNRRVEQYRGTEKLPIIKDKTAILVDDGLATGLTAKAAIAYLKKLNPAKIIVAAPTCAADTAKEFRKKNKVSLFCLTEPEMFLGVGQFYLDFPQVTDEEVIKLIGKLKKAFLK